VALQEKVYISSNVLLLCQRHCSIFITSTNALKVSLLQTCGFVLLNK